MKDTDSDKNRIEDMHALLTDMITMLIRHPERSEVQKVVVGPMIAFSISVDKETGDFGRIMGREGKHFTGIRVIMASMAALIDRECDVSMNEERTPVLDKKKLPFSMGEYSRKNFLALKDLLKRVVWPFLAYPKELEISSTTLGVTVILELKVAADDYPHIYGGPTSYQENQSLRKGEDGCLLQAIKNIFDGIGKNNGRIILIVLTKK